MEKCSSCIYYKQFIDDDYGQCRFNAPNWVDLSKSYGDTRCDARFPVLKSDEWCGQFKEVKPPVDIEGKRMSNEISECSDCGFMDLYFLRGGYDVDKCPYCKSDDWKETYLPDAIGQLQDDINSLRELMDD